MSPLSPFSQMYVDAMLCFKRPCPLHTSDSFLCADVSSERCDFMLLAPHHFFLSGELTTRKTLCSLCANATPIKTSFGMLETFLTRVRVPWLHVFGCECPRCTLADDAFLADPLKFGYENRHVQMHASSHHLSKNFEFAGGTSTCNQSNLLLPPSPTWCFRATTRPSATLASANWTTP